MQSADLLENLIGFATVSRQSNLELVAFVQDFLAKANIQSTLVKDPIGGNTNLFATVGPAVPGGVVLSGHTDVVPTAGQTWSSDPFKLTKIGDRLFGRGAADMKGFLACALSAAQRAATRPLSAPLHLAFSCDEEIGCVGVRSLIASLQSSGPKARLCIVGEPTSMQVATGHKGKTALSATCCGRAGHSALAPQLLNPINLACELVMGVGRLQSELAATFQGDPAYDIPYPTIHVGKIKGGEALNVVSSLCELELELRTPGLGGGSEILEAIKTEAARIRAACIGAFPEADIRIEILNSYPGLETPPDSEAARFVSSLTGSNGYIKLAFGTEGGLISEGLTLPTVVCGPGSMDQGHKPDEFVSLDQIARCDLMMDNLIDRLAA